VAAHAGVGIGTVYRYFADFADLLEVVFSKDEIYAKYHTVLSPVHKVSISHDSDNAEAIALDALRALIDALTQGGVDTRT
jgi:AcrR family transcriptional regulator